MRYTYKILYFFKQIRNGVPKMEHKEGHCLLHDNRSQINKIAIDEGVINTETQLYPKKSTSL